MKRNRFRAPLAATASLALALSALLVAGPADAADDPTPTRRHSHPE